MAFLDSLINLLSSIESDKIAVHDERCVVMRNRNVECLRCVRACTSDALELTDGELAVHPEKCIGCGTCAAACPTSAIEVRTPTDAELTSALKRSIVATKGHPVIACEKAVRAARKQHEDAAPSPGLARGPGPEGEGRPGPRRGDARGSALPGARGRVAHRRHGRLPLP